MGCEASRGGEASCGDRRAAAEAAASFGARSTSDEIFLRPQDRRGEVRADRWMPRVQGDPRQEARSDAQPWMQRAHLRQG